MIINQIIYNNGAADSDGKTSYSVRFEHNLELSGFPGFWIRFRIALLFLFFGILDLKPYSFTLKYRGRPST